MPTPITTALSSQDVTLTLANQAVRLDPAAGVQTLTVYFAATGGFWSAAGVEGQTLPQKNPIVADTYFQIKVKGDSLFLESATPGQLVKVIGEG